MRRVSAGVSRALILACAGGATLLASPAGVRADFVVARGYDLFNTTPRSPGNPGGTQFLGIPFTGLPIGRFNFGPGIGIRNVGNTDTIIQRLNAATRPTATPGFGTPVRLVVRALQLVSTIPVPAFGNQRLFATLQSIRRGPAATGTMNIFFANRNGGFFNSSLRIPIDIRVGGPQGRIIFSTVLNLSSRGVPWTHFAPPGALLIRQVNFLLKGNGTQDRDFWPSRQFVETGPTGNEIHQVRPATPSGITAGF